MAQLAYLDCFAGISGDMFLGAMLDLGLAIEDLERELLKLDLRGYRLTLTSVEKRGLRAAQFKVLLDAPDGGHDADQPNAHQHHRSFTHIRGLIGRSALSAAVKDNAIRIFTRLAEAEAAVHGVALDDVRFHELGAVDAIVDITGAAIAVELLDITAIVCSPLHLGSGFVKMAHGLYPVPAPATARLLAGVPVYGTETRGELVTPTGAAIATTLATRYGPLPAMSIARTGHGAGTKDREFPNVLRVFLGESLGVHLPASTAPAVPQPAPSAELPVIAAPRAPHPEQHLAGDTDAGWHEGPATVIEANIDDMNPQLFESLGERLLAAGALDVLLIPAQMKKGRPGVLLQVLAHPDSVDALLAIVFTESTTIGARTHDVTKRMLRRELRTVDTEYGPVRVKIAWMGARIVNAAPEYADCRALAAQRGVSLKQVMGAASAAGLLAR